MKGAALDDLTQRHRDTEVIRWAWASRRDGKAQRAPVDANGLHLDMSKAHRRDGSKASRPVR